MRPEHPGLRTGWKFGLVALMALMLGACGLTAPRGSEGYADLDSLGVLDTDRTIALSVGPTLLRFAARHMDDEPEIQAMLRGLDGVRVRIYEIDGDGLRVAGRIRGMSANLQEQGWEPVALIREAGEQTHLLVKTRGGQVKGLTLIASDGDSEAVVINLMGDLEPEYFSDVMVALEVDAPEVQVAAVQ